MQGVNKALLVKSARRASQFLKTLSNEHRMLVLCNLADSEKTVSELERLLGIRQPTLSQQLSRLRADGLVTTRRNGKSIHYSLASEEARTLMGVLYQLFCAPAAAAVVSARRRTPAAKPRAPARRPNGRTIEASQAVPPHAKRKRRAGVSGAERANHGSHQ